MAAGKMNKIDLLQALRNYNRPYYTVADLEKILGQEREILYVTLNRLVKSGTLIRLKKGVYQSPFQALETEKVASELYYPSYLSFESALSRHGILSQIPYVLTFATTRLTKRMFLAGKEAEFRKIKKELFFGYDLVKGIYLAEPEKAVLDMLYFIGKGKAAGETSEWSLSKIDKEKLIEYAQAFPKHIRISAQKLLRGEVKKGEEVEISL